MTEIALQNDANGSPAAILQELGGRSIVLIGMMGVGKSSIGRRLAARLGIPFVDADMEIEKAAGMSIADIFARHGEAEFRSGEARVIARLLEGGPQVLATGGGAFMNPRHPRADPGQRRIRSGSRPTSTCCCAGSASAAATGRSCRPPIRRRPCARLLAQREPVYAQADITVQSRDVAHDAIVADIMTALASFLRPPHRQRDRQAYGPEATERKVGQ